MTCPECASTDVKELKAEYVFHQDTTFTYQCNACQHVFTQTVDGRDGFFVEQSESLLKKTVSGS